MKRDSVQNLSRLRVLLFINGSAAGRLNAWKNRQLLKLYSPRFTEIIPHWKQCHETETKTFTDFGWTRSEFFWSCNLIVRWEYSWERLLSAIVNCSTGNLKWNQDGDNNENMPKEEILWTRKIARLVRFETLYNSKPSSGNHQTLRGLVTVIKTMNYLRFYLELYASLAPM